MANKKRNSIKVDEKKFKRVESKMEVLKHISKRNCALLPYLDEESLHSLGEFVYNVITQRVNLDKLQQKKVKKILHKNKAFFIKLIDKHTKNPIAYFKSSLKSDPQIGQGVVSLIAGLAPLLASLLVRKR